MKLKTRIIAFILMLLLAMFLNSCCILDSIFKNEKKTTNSSHDDSSDHSGDLSEKGGNLIINGVGVYSEYTEVVNKSQTGKTILVNVKDLLTNLDYTWEKHENGKIYIKKDDKTYLLDLNNETLTRTGDNFNLLGENKENGYTFEIKNNTVIIDAQTIELATRKMDAEVYIRNFYGDSKVYVISALTESDEELYNAVIDGRKLNIPDIFTLYLSNDASDSVRVMPLIKTLKECGFKITQNNDSKFVISVGAKKYTIDLENDEIRCGGKKVELGLAGGSPESMYQKSEGDELYCSTVIVRALIEHMGKKVYLFDLDSGIYIILQRQ